MITDWFDKEIKVGDMVIRSKLSGFTLHRVLKISNKAVKLSCKREQIFSTMKRVDSTSFEDLDNQYNHFYIPLSVANFSLVNVTDKYLEYDR